MLYSPTFFICTKFPFLRYSQLFSNFKIINYATAHQSVLFLFLFKFDWQKVSTNNGAFKICDDFDSWMKRKSWPCPCKPLFICRLENSQFNIEQTFESTPESQSVYQIPVEWSLWPWWLTVPNMPGNKWKREKEPEQNLTSGRPCWVYGWIWPCWQFKSNSGAISKLLFSSF